MLPSQAKQRYSAAYSFKYHVLTPNRKRKQQQNMSVSNDQRYKIEI